MLLEDYIILYIICVAGRQYNTVHRLCSWKTIYIWWDAVNTCCFTTLKMSYDLNCFLEGRRLVNLLFEWKLRNAMDGSVLHIAVTTEEAQEVLRPMSEDGRFVSGEVLSFRTEQRSVNLM